MQALWRLLPMVVVGAVLVVQGYVHGVWTDRWTVSEHLEAAVSRLDKIPLAVGDWEGEILEPLKPHESGQAGFAGHRNCRYVNRRSGAVVMVLLACGRSGPISVHTPEICYRGAGYEPVGAMTKHTETAGHDDPAELWCTQFRKANTQQPNELRIFWTWNAAGSWKAATNPRFTFGGAAVLFKLYVIHEVVPRDASSDRVSNDFLSQMLPALSETLFPST